MKAFILSTDAEQKPVLESDIALSWKHLTDFELAEVCCRLKNMTPGQSRQLIGKIHVMCVDVPEDQL